MKREEQRDYRRAMDSLRFSEEAKASIVRGLTLAEKTASQPKRRFKKLKTAGIAAALVLALTAGAAASGYVDVREAFRGVFANTAETEVIDRIGVPIGASDSDGGITMTAEAIICDGYNYAITYSLQKDDGTPFDVATLDNGCLDAYFDRESTSLGTFSGAHGASWFYDADPSEPSIQYVEMWSYEEKIPTGKTVNATFGDLRAIPNSDADKADEPIAKGTWHLKFEMNYEPIAKDLPAGQQFTIDGKSATLDSAMLSPVGYRFVYTVEGEASFDNVANGKEPAQHATEREAFNAHITLTLKDGTVFDTSAGGSSLSVEDGHTTVIDSDLFDRLVRMEDIASVTIGDLTLPI